MSSKPCPDGPLKGSRLQMLSYVGKREPDLSEEILARLRGKGARYKRLEWVSPIESTGFTEYRDKEFLECLGLSHLAPQLLSFWPENGPCWDGLAKVYAVRESDSPAVVLVEAKSHRLEVCGSGCGATNKQSTELIDQALDATARWVGSRCKFRRNSYLYQYVNRLAHLYFFREFVQPSLDAWLVNLYFTGDPYRPTSEEQWADFLSEVKWNLGIDRLPPYVLDVFLPAVAG